MAVSNELIEKRAELDAKRDRFAAALAAAKNAAAGTDRAYDDAALAKGLGVEAKDLRDEIAKRNREINDLGVQVDALAAKENIDRTAPTMPTSPRETEPVKAKGLGTLFVESAAYKATAERHAWKSGMSAEVQIDLKTLMQSDGAGNGGWAPAYPDLPGFTGYAVRPPQIIDFLPRYRTTSSTIAFMEETTHTDNAVEKAQGAAFGEQAYVFTRQTRIVEKIPASIPVTEEQLEDVVGIEDFLNVTLSADVMRRLDLQCYAGNGTSPNLAGITDHASIQTQAKGTDPVFDAIMKAITKVNVTGRASANVLFIHSADWQDLVLTRTADGLYILGNPAGAPVSRLWGLTVVPNEACTENTACVVDTRYSGLYIKRDLQFAIGRSGTQFVEGEYTVIATIRAAQATRRGAAACTVTSI